MNSFIFALNILKFEKFSEAWWDTRVKSTFKRHRQKDHEGSLSHTDLGNFGLRSETQSHNTKTKIERSNVLTQFASTLKL